MSFDGASFEKYGYERPRVATQAIGGQRGLTVWGVAILAKDLATALRDPWLFSSCAGEIRVGDRVFLASYLDAHDFKAERRAEVAELLAKEVTPPDRARRLVGQVVIEVIRHDDFREAGRMKLLEYKPVINMEAPAA